MHLIILIFLQSLWFKDLRMYNFNIKGSVQNITELFWNLDERNNAESTWWQKREELAELI